MCAGSIINDMSTFVIEGHMLDWHSCQICYPLEIKVLLLLVVVLITFDEDLLLNILYDNAFRNEAETKYMYL